MAVVSAASLAFGLVVIALAAGVTRRMVLADRLPRNGGFGLRTAATMRSDAAWTAGHRAAVPLLGATCGVAVAGAVMVLAAAVGMELSEEPAGTVLAVVLGVSGVGYVLVVGLMVAAGLVANRSAKLARTG